MKTTSFTLGKIATYFNTMNLSNWKVWGEKWQHEALYTTSHYYHWYYVISSRTSAKIYECAIYRDPMILVDLCGLLPRFKTKRSGIISGIEKVFPQDGMQQVDRDVTKFL